MSNKKILVVEDNPVNLKTIVSVLEKAGYTVISAMTGEEGLKLALEKIPDLFLLDIDLPGMNGYELGEALRNFPETRDVPQCYVTSLLDKEEERELDHKLVGHFFFAKPFNSKDLLTEISKWI